VNDVEAAFIRAIQRDPEDDDARLVYADWLEQRGDPRGELLRLDVQLRRIPPRRAALVDVVDPTWLSLVRLRYRVVLLGSPDGISTIKVIREITRLGLKDAKDLVDAAQATGRAVVCADVDPGAARSIAAAFDGVATVRVESYIASVPERPARLPTVSLQLVSVDGARRDEAIQMLRELTGWSEAAAQNLVEEVVGGDPASIRIAADEATASGIVARFRGIADIYIERRFG
jgi:uncharacterized protein (TIGR02996 family)